MRFNPAFAGGRILPGVAGKTTVLAPVAPFAVAPGGGVTGPITDNEDKAVAAKGEALTDEQILSMKFLVSGVQGKVAQ